MNTGDMIQIEAPDFDPDIDEALPIPTDQNIDHQETQGSVNSTQQFPEKTAECFIAPRSPRHRLAGHNPSRNPTTARPKY